MRIHSYHTARIHQQGLTLVELMIAITLGLFVIGGVTIVFVNSSRARAELEKTSQQIENGRYATQLLADDLRMAGFFGEFNPTTSAAPTPSAKPDPCATDSTSLVAAVGLSIQGYDNGVGLPPTCATWLGDLKANTDVVVIRRVSSCIAGSTGCDAVDYTKYTYFQANRCGTVATSYAIGNAASNFTLTKADCATAADKRSYYTRIYFIANNNKTGDGIPTLKMAELVSGNFSVVPLVAGIEQMQLEYGIDTNPSVNKGTPSVYTADPDKYGAGGVACAGINCQTNWRNVVAVKIHILARNTESTQGYRDGRDYVLGVKFDGTSNKYAADNAAYKRHAYTTVVRLMNVAGRLE
jgi:type IV pilus assembly protein PilW